MTRANPMDCTVSDDAMADDVASYTADPHDPEAITREAVEAMRARGPVDPEMERALIGAGRQHAELLARIGWPEGAADG